MLRLVSSRPMMPKSTRLNLLTLEDRLVPTGQILPERYVAVGSEAGTAPVVTIIDTDTNQVALSFEAYDKSVTTGVAVDLGDFTGDGIADIVTASGIGGGPHIRIFDGVTGQQLQTALGNFFAGDPAARQGADLTTVDFNDDGLDDLFAFVPTDAGIAYKLFDGADGKEMPIAVGRFSTPAGDMLAVRSTQGNADSQNEIYIREPFPGPPPIWSGGVRPMTQEETANAVALFQAPAQPAVPAGAGVNGEVKKLLPGTDKTSVSLIFLTYEQMIEQGVSKRTVDWEKNTGAKPITAFGDLLNQLNLSHPLDEYELQYTQLVDANGKTVVGPNGKPIEFIFVVHRPTGNIARAGWELTNNGIKYGLQFFDNFGELNREFATYFRLMLDALSINAMLVANAIPWPQLTPAPLPKTVAEMLKEVNLGGRIRATSGMNPAEAGAFFGWKPSTVTKGIGDFTREQLLAKGWTKESLLDIAKAYEQIAKITPANPSAAGRAAQLREIAKIFD